ncbi:MAG: AAA family ATPase [Alcaligenaceae bacterium]|nr:AAA family ATPase [Alcaligenaceae bacterium]
MHQRWTLHIENFAKIKQADIEMRPLTLLVGENNSGKSYVATLMWALWALPYSSIYPRTAPTTETYEKCLQAVQDCFRQLHHNTQEKVTFTTEQQQLFVDWFNDILHKNKTQLVKEAFQKEISIGKLSIQGYTNTVSISFLKNDNLKLPFQLKGYDFKIPSSFLELLAENQPEKISKGIYYKIIKDITYTLLFTGYSDGTALPASLEAILTKHLNLNFNSIPLFMPASRTGFMLTYPALVAEAFEGNSVSLTKPIQLFLKGLTQQKNKKNPKLSLISDWLEQELLKGAIERQETDTLPQYQYRSFQEHTTIPMYLTSSLVAELAPIIHFLRTFNRYSGLFIEEPEAHLHPAAQRIMARAIARIKNEGIPVAITTHGDTLFQQLNNLAVLYNHPRQKPLMAEFGYSKQELLNPQDMVAYQFKNTQQGTLVQKLESTEYGIPVPTFNDPLEELLNEVYKLQGTE